MKASRPYARLMRQLIGHIAQANTEYTHPVPGRARETSSASATSIVSTDRGLCGGLNSHLFRQLLADMREWQDKGVEVDVVAIGQQGRRRSSAASRSTWSARSRTWARGRRSSS